MSSSPIHQEKPILDQYEESDWKELPQWIREAASVLGYTKKLWDKDKEPSTCQKDWSTLSIPEQKAATSLGYNANLWDGDSSESCSESSDDDGEVLSPKTTTTITTGKKLYCIQLYTETKDYRLQIREGMGISMHANRSMGKDEIIMTSPTGPSNHQTLLQASSSSSSLLSPERTAFAQRFVEWQKLYGRTDRPGASGYKLSFTVDDFSYVPDLHRIEDHILPTESNPSYHMELYENDVVIVEFISPNNNNSDSSCDNNTSSSSSSSLLPPERRFEILDFDEALVEDCEENYDPKIMKRPTSLCGCETRCLEVPGHFNNHACGSSATAYDTVRLADDDCSSSCPLVAPGQPSWVQEELQSKCEFPDIPNMMTTHRALVPGDEITTNYILWHWSNDDYIPNSSVNVTPTNFFDEWEWEELPSKIVKAAKILGYTQTIWDEDREVDISAFEKDWKELTSEERDAAKVLGYTDNSWNETEEEKKEESPSPAVVSHHEDDTLIDDMDWDELTDEQRKAALALGYNEVNWDADDEDIPLSDLYWCQLTPEQQTSAATIGYNQLNWDSSGAEEPWFYCRCGDDKCHSADGFRGLKYLPVEEQKRLYWVVEPYVQHQIAWKLYQLEQEKEGI